jgi:hypothetical protein
VPLSIEANAVAFGAKKILKFAYKRVQVFFGSMVIAMKFSVVDGQFHRIFAFQGLALPCVNPNNAIK